MLDTITEMIKKGGSVAILAVCVILLWFAQQDFQSDILEFKQETKSLEDKVAILTSQKADLEYVDKKYDKLCDLIKDSSNTTDKQLTLIIDRLDRLDDRLYEEVKDARD